MGLHKEIFFLIIKVGLTSQNSIVSFQCCVRNIWETTETILKANYTIVRKQEISVSKHKDISMQSIQQEMLYSRSLSEYYITQFYLQLERGIFSICHLKLKKKKKRVIIQMKNGFEHNPEKDAETLFWCALGKLSGWIQNWLNYSFTLI